MKPITHIKLIAVSVAATTATLFAVEYIDPDIVIINALMLPLGVGVILAIFVFYYPFCLMAKTDFCNVRLGDSPLWKPVLVMIFIFTILVYYFIFLAIYKSIQHFKKK